MNMQLKNMKKPLKKATILFVTGCLAGLVRAEFGVSAGASFNYKANFKSSAITLPRAFDPGTTAAGTDHFYDDGYNRVDSSGNLGGQTTYWGYQDSVSQYNPLGDGGNGTITMNSSQTTLAAGSSSEDQSELQPAMEVYWQQDLTENKKWNLGVRVASRWQRIELANRALSGTTYTRISDTYSLGGSPVPADPYSGPFSGWPLTTLDDSPLTRTLSSGIGPAISTTRKLDANIFALDVGPTASLNIIDNLSAAASAGGTVAWIQSDFSYSDGTLASGNSSDGKCLFGAYVGIDLRYKFSERWGVFAGAAYNLLQDFYQEAEGRSAELQFGNSYTVRAGIFFQ
jgi:hypothetical protein